MLVHQRVPWISNALRQFSAASHHAMFNEAPIVFGTATPVSYDFWAVGDQSTVRALWSPCFCSVSISFSLYYIYIHVYIYMCVCAHMYTYSIYIIHKIRIHPYVYIEWCLEESSMSDVFSWFAWDGPTFGHGLLVTCCDAEGTDCCSGSQADFSCRGLAAHDAEMTWSLLGVLLQGFAFLKWQVDAGKWAQNWFTPPIKMVIWGMVCYCFTHINQFAFACRYLGLHRRVRPIFQQSSTISGWLIIVYPPRSMGVLFNHDIDCGSEATTTTLRPAEASGRENCDRDRDLRGGGKTQSRGRKVGRKTHLGGLTSSPP